MNPLTNVKNITKLNELELSRGTKKSWHDMYKESAWIFVGGLAYGLTEGDILSVFSQYGEIVNINLIRDAKTGKIKGFCFLCYANQKSTVLAVDNFNGIKLCGRTIRVDHVSNYKPPKDHENDDELTKQLKSEGCAPKAIKIEKEEFPNIVEIKQEKKKSKKVKKEKKKHKKKRKHDDNDEETHKYKKVKVKEEKIDPGYTKNELPVREKRSKRKDKQKDSSDSETDSSVSDSSDSDSNSQLISRKGESSRKHKMKQIDNSISNCQLTSRKGESSRKHKMNESDSYDSDSNSQLMSRKVESSHKHNMQKSGQSYKEKYDNRINPRSGMSNDDDTYRRSEITHRERDLSSSGSYDKSHKQKRYQDDDYLKDLSSKSKSYRPSDQDQKGSQSDDDRYKDYPDSKKKKRSSEYNQSDFKRRRYSSASSSENYISKRPKSRVQGKQNEEPVERCYKPDKERYSNSQKKRESSPNRRDDKRNERKSRHERDHR